MKHNYNGFMGNNSYRSGQMLLITLLVLAVATTIALSLIGRTTTDLSMSTQVEESSRAFSAAEAGIEQALKLQTKSGLSGTLAGGSNYKVDSTTIGGSTATYVFPNQTPNGQGETLWMVDHTDTGTPDWSTKIYNNNNLTLCWGSGAVEVVAYYLHGANVIANLQVSRQMYDYDSSSHLGARSESNNFKPINGTGCGPGTGTNHSTVINFPADFGIDTTGSDNIIMFRIRPLYVAGSTQLAVTPSGVDLPRQGTNYASCGTTGGGTKRCINVYQNYKSPPAIFDYVLYADGGSISPVKPN
jgi:hypothetical protein